MKFEKISFKQFKKDMIETFNLTDDDVSIELIEELYDDIKLPKRATTKSAGHDFFSPIYFTLCSGESIKIPTGIRVLLDDDKVLECYPRSGLGFKYRLQLDNTVGIIDADYSDSDNEGHIMLKITNDSKEDKTLDIERGKAFAQGIVKKYYIMDDDEVIKTRNGGFGSTSK